MGTNEEQHITKNILELPILKEITKDTYTLVCSNGRTYRFNMSQLMDILKQECEHIVDERLQQISQELNDINGGTTEYIDTYQNVIDFLDGYTENQKLKDVIAALEERIKTLEDKQ